MRYRAPSSIIHIHPAVHTLRIFFLPPYTNFIPCVPTPVEHLVPVLPLVPASPVRRTRSLNISRLDLTATTSLLSTSRAARKQHQNRSKEEHHKRREQGPDALPVRCVAVTIIIDLLLDDAPGDEIGDQDNEGDEPCDGGDERCAQGTEDGGAEGGEEGEECETAGYGVEDHDARERISGVLGGRAVVASVFAIEVGDGRVADVGLCAGASLVTGVPEGTKVDVSAIREVHAQDGHAVNDWRGDGGDEEEDACYEE
ncbi:hypothetical protein V495_08588 [Pseudogymnoascus sp. VKM F-4514 (FW-929)]|nr:hypothetical protein V495_08588 [Pseudogymnoascus sp. VKM F-4514 (FW-929)]KFY64441.1 hypothetical protein V497_01727 [Pseudogymnoascus sp. VKM F-4516 (FW-969)]